mmetsp:Transcript_11669/g.23719  ORF Transcript_11669/g.23719 Transcript_11669/m.23719 type:complete len:598 (-) Transcript_11669:140-1933(-)
MGVSPSGTLTLLFLVFIGPIIYAGNWAYKKFIKGEDGTLHDPDHVEKEGEREQLSSKQYLFALVGYAIGIGNIWRFPYVIASNGGAAALFAYLVCAVLVSVPLFLYELIIGQSIRLSTIRCYEMIHPRWKSLGYASGAMLFMVLSYYAQVVAYTLPYIIDSCKDPLPWVEKGAEDHWRFGILEGCAAGEEKNGLGGIVPRLAISLFCFWIITLLSASFGSEILSKITYVTVYMPVVLMIILVIRTPFLEGAGDGIEFYIGKFEAEKLSDLTVWATACSQILFSLSPGFGTAITYSSYTRRKEDVYRICLITAISNSAFSITGGFAVFSILGHVAFKDGVPVEVVASRSGTGLAFITIAEAMQYFGSLSNVMSVLFFVMLLTLGLDSAYAWLETVVSYVADFMDERGFKKQPTWKLTCGVVLVQFLIGLLFATRRGNDLLDVIDFYAGTLFLLVVCALEGVMLNIDFGWERMATSLKIATYGNPGTPTGRRIMPTWLCMIDFRLTVPAITGFLGIYNFQKVIKDPYGGYESGILAFGWACFGLLIAISLGTMWKQGPSGLPPLEDLKKELEDEMNQDVADKMKVESNGDGSAGSEQDA